MVKIYHNPKCSKSRASLALLEELPEEVEVVKYLETPLNKEELQQLMKKLRCRPSDILRKTEKIIQEESIDLVGEEAILEALVQYPKLMQRPIIERGNQAVIGRPPENVNLLFEN